MHGIYVYLQPAFMLVLVLATTVALYMGVFHAHRKAATGSKAVFGVLSGLISAVSWLFMYSHHYIGW